MTLRVAGRASPRSLYRIPGVVPQHKSVRRKHGDSRQRTSNFWIPPVTVEKQVGANDATTLLTRAGYIRQAYAGIFHILPLGLRVQEKLERLIDKHMRSVDASKVSLSSISSQSLWLKSKRLLTASELFKFSDRKSSKLLLAPTHEEEITDLLANVVRAGKQLPVRLYQIGRKYRDEKRPRGGLLRGREFLMEDLYTFDATVEDAHRTYDVVRNAYRNFLDELTIPYIEARAESGDMGGDLSHEYHFPNAAGEDTVITCSKCDLARNEEYTKKVTYRPLRIEALPSNSHHFQDVSRLLEKHYLGSGGHDLIKAFALHKHDTAETNSSGLDEINPYSLKATLEGILDVDTGIENPLESFNASRLRFLEREKNESGQRNRIYYVLDKNVPDEAIAKVIENDMQSYPEGVDFLLVNSASNPAESINLLRHREGDDCPQCKEGKLAVRKAIEIGHTFHLGTRYSSLLDLNIRQPINDNKQEKVTPVEMGCHGIGVSRLIAAVASCLKDDQGLVWPRVIAPFEAAILTAREHGSKAEALYDQLSSYKDGAVDTIIDDRDATLPFKMKDADMLGYPVLIILGKSFAEGLVEVQCRRINLKEKVPVDQVVQFVHDVLKKL